MQWASNIWPSPLPYSLRPFCRVPKNYNTWSNILFHQYQTPHFLPRHLEITSHIARNIKMCLKCGAHVWNNHHYITDTGATYFTLYQLLSQLTFYPPSHTPTSQNNPRSPSLCYFGMAMVGPHDPWIIFFGALAFFGWDSLYTFLALCLPASLHGPFFFFFFASSFFI